MLRVEVLEDAEIEGETRREPGYRPDQLFPAGSG